MRRSSAIACLLLILGPGSAGADSDFIPPPLPAPPPATDGAETSRAEVERARREIDRRLEERRLERTGSRRDVDAHRAREERALERETGSVPEGDAERVRADIERAERRIELERDVERLSRRSGSRAKRP
jgi:hypothetical protein